MSEAPPTDSHGPKLREVRYRHSPGFVEILRQLGATLLVSTYQAGKLGAISAVDGKLWFSFHNLDQAMGLAVSPSRLAVGAKGQIWFFDSNRQLAPTLKPAGQFEACYLARSAHVTGGIHCHEMAWSGDGGPSDELWIVNTLFSCLATLHPEYSFIYRWRPPFVTQLAGEDRCHLNGMAMREGRPAFVTMMAQSDSPAGWRPHKESTGIIMDVTSGEPVTTGLAMPHSPRWRDGQMWVLNSGHGSLEAVDVVTGKRDIVQRFPGYTRGLAFCGPFAFVGLSRIRETAVFGGMPIAQERENLTCGVGVVDLRSGQQVASLEFETGVEEIFDVQILPDCRCAAICGPRPDLDDAQDIWVVPPPDQVERIVESRTAISPMQSHPSSYTAREADVKGWIEQALSLQRERRVSEAIELFERAAAVRPQSAEIWNHLGNALQDAGRQEQGLDCYRRAVEADPRFGPGLQNLGYVLVAQGYTDEGVRRLEKAQRVQPADVNHVLIATALPVVYESLDDLRARRAVMTGAVQKLADSGLKIDTTNTLVPTNFFAAYQGENDRELHANLGRIYQGVDLCSGRGIECRGDKRRVGVLSAYFRDHTIGRLNIGRIEHLPREQFEVVVLSVGGHQDDMAERYRRTGDKFVVVPRQVALARKLIADEQLDILFFADVGMDALTYTLAFSRMAPVQAVTWGHPVTTGSPTMDCFLSSELLETPESESHYTERLVKSPSLATYYERPTLTAPKRARSFFGLPADAPLYGCPQTLFKFHPDFDAVLAAILRSDARAELVLLEGRTANWTQQLKARFNRSMPDLNSRMRWLPALPNSDYLQLISLCDVMLDPLHFGGGNTTYEALAMGTPVVTLSGAYLRSRISLGLYRKMGEQASSAQTPAPVADTTNEYIQLACELAASGRYRERCREWIAQRGEQLFADPQEVEDFAKFLGRLGHADAVDW